MIFIYFGAGRSGLLFSVLTTLLALGFPSRIFDVISTAFRNFTNSNAGRRGWFVYSVASKSIWGVLLVAALAFSYLIHKEVMQYLYYRGELLATCFLKY